MKAMSTAKPSTPAVFCAQGMRVHALDVGVHRRARAELPTRDLNVGSQIESGLFIGKRVIAKVATVRGFDAVNVP
jgi:hypothetical protein